MKRLQVPPVHPPRGLHDDLLRPTVLQDAGDLAEAVRAVGGGVVPPVQVNVERACSCSQKCEILDDGLG